MREASPKLKILLAALLFLNLSLHPVGHALFLPGCDNPHWASNSQPAGDPELGRGPADCLLCRNAGSLLTQPVPLGEGPPEESWAALSPSRSLPCQPSSIDCVTPRAPPAA